jgi:hypothetical protein
MKSEQSEPETETDEGFGYDLERFFPASSRRCDHHSLREKDSIYTDFASSHQIQFQESDVPNSHAASLRYTLEAFDQADGLALDSSGHGHADNYAVEAIERATGSELASNSESEISATILNRPSSETPVKFLESQSPDRHPVQTSDALIDSQEYGPIDSLENWTTDHRMAKADDGSNGHAPEDDNGAEWDTDAEDGKLRVLSTNATFVAARLPIFGPICPLEPPVDSQRIFGNLFKNKCDQNEFDSSETQTKEDSALESQSDWKSVDGLGDETKVSMLPIPSPHLTPKLRGYWRKVSPSRRGLRFSSIPCPSPGKPNISLKRRHARVQASAAQASATASTLSSTSTQWNPVQSKRW